MAAWNAPDYAAPGRILVRPDITVNGEVVAMDTTYPVLRSESVALLDRVLQLRTPGGRLTVDWRGDVPRFAGSTPGE